MFADDNPAECAEVAAALPAVDTVASRRPAVGARRGRSPRACGFEASSLTDEEPRAAGSYAAPRAGRGAATAAASLEDFWRSLEMRARVRARRRALARARRAADAEDEPVQPHARAAARVEEVERLAGEPTSICRTLELEDRFAQPRYRRAGDRRCPPSDDAEPRMIDTLLLSCRVIGRTAERHLLAHVVARALERGFAAAAGHLRRQARETRSSRISTRGSASSPCRRRGSWEYDLAQRARSRATTSPTTMSEHETFDADLRRTCSRTSSAGARARRRRRPGDRRGWDSLAQIRLVHELETPLRRSPAGRRAARGADRRLAEATRAESGSRARSAAPPMRSFASYEGCRRIRPRERRRQPASCRRAVRAALAVRWLRRARLAARHSALLGSCRRDVSRARTCRRSFGGAAVVDGPGRRRPGRSKAGDPWELATDGTRPRARPVGRPRRAGDGPHRRPIETARPLGAAMRTVPRGAETPPAGDEGRGAYRARPALARARRSLGARAARPRLCCGGSPGPASRRDGASRPPRPLRRRDARRSSGRAGGDAAESRCASATTTRARARPRRPPQYARRERRGERSSASREPPAADADGRRSRRAAPPSGEPSSSSGGAVASAPRSTLALLARGHRRTPSTRPPGDAADDSHAASPVAPTPHVCTGPMLESPRSSRRCSIGLAGGDASSRARARSRGAAARR